MIGQRRLDFTIHPYQADWQADFVQEAARLKDALGEDALRIEHIGSTSIPGMHAKAIIDIMVAVASLEKARELVPVLEALGYVYRPLDTVPDRVYFRKGYPPDYRTHHLNLVARDSTFWSNHLAFRDTLRAHDDLAGEYIALKRRIAADYARTQVIDLEAKTPFVQRVLALAAGEKKNGEAG